MYCVSSTALIFLKYESLGENFFCASLEKRYSPELEYQSL